MSTKHRVKVVSVNNDIMTLKVDGVMCSYLIQRPQPLGFADAKLLGDVMDTRLLESLVQSFDLVRPQKGLLKWFLDLWRHRNEPPLLGNTIADYIERVGVEVDVDKKTKGVVILKSDVDKIREGRFYDSVSKV